MANFYLRRCDLVTGKHLSQMKCPAGAVLNDLLAATEAIGDKDGLRSGLADGGQENAFGESLRNLEFFALEAKGASHAAAAGVEKSDVGSRAAQEIELGIHLHERLVVAVAVEQDTLPAKHRRLIAGRILREEIAEEKALIAKCSRPGMVREEIPQLVAKNAGAGRLKKNDGKSCINFGSKNFEDALKIAARSSQKTEIIERTPAA